MIDPYFIVAACTGPHYVSPNPAVCQPVTDMTLVHSRLSDADFFEEIPEIVAHFDDLAFLANLSDIEGYEDVDGSHAEQLLDEANIGNDEVSLGAMLELQSVIRTLLDRLITVLFTVQDTIPASYNAPSTGMVTVNGVPMLVSSGYTKDKRPTASAIAINLFNSMGLFDKPFSRPDAPSKD